MFEMNANVGDLKRVFGIIRCSSENANVFLSNNVLCIESPRPVITFSRACIRSCGGIIAVSGDSRFVVSAVSILGVLSTGRNHEIANIAYDGENKLRIRICNVIHVVNVDTDSEISVSSAIDSRSFIVMQNITGKDFIAITKSADDSLSEDITLSTIKSLFRLGSTGGKYVSYIEAHSDTLLDYSARFDPEYLYSLSKLVRSDDELCVMFSGNSPAMIRFDLNMWSIDYLVAPIINND